MNGAMDDPPPITIKNPRSNKTTITGANQNFLRSFIKPHKSLSKSISKFKILAFTDAESSSVLQRLWLIELLCTVACAELDSVSLCAFFISLFQIQCSFPKQADPL